MSAWKILAYPFFHKTRYGATITSYGGRPVIDEAQKTQVCDWRWDDEHAFRLLRVLKDNGLGPNQL